MHEPGRGLMSGTIVCSLRHPSHTPTQQGSGVYIPETQCFSFSFRGLSSSSLFTTFCWVNLFACLFVLAQVSPGNSLPKCEFSQIILRFWSSVHSVLLKPHNPELKCKLPRVMADLHQDIQGYLCLASTQLQVLAPVLHTEIAVSC